MKCRSPIIFIIIFLCSYNAFSQDTSENQKLSENQTYHFVPQQRNYESSKPSTPHIYRDTRLGSSSPLYNTYKKNNYGAGAVTTNPHKSGSSVLYKPYHLASTKKSSAIYRDTRLGSSSPLYNTYEKNDYGAGAVTTNPHK